MIYNAIKNFNKQFEYEPVIENAKKLPPRKKLSGYIVCGMGGSHLAADLIKIWRPDFPLIVWNNYGLPDFAKASAGKLPPLVIVSSYSGNTEETLSAFNEARAKHIPVAAIATGGKLIAWAKKHKVPYIEMPDIHIQPRLSSGMGLKALLALTGEVAAMREVAELAKKINPVRQENHGKSLARILHGSVPIIYSSVVNYPIANNWKIKFNETGKIPAFANSFPELNHNEMTGFDANVSTESLSKKFRFIFLKDKNDHTRVIKRMNVTEGLLRKRRFDIEIILLHGENAWQKIFNALVLADWTAYYTGKQYGVEVEQVPMVEEFKELIK